MILGLIAPTAGRVEVLGETDGAKLRSRIGFLPEERAWMDQLFGPERYIDAFRALVPEGEHYTWWSNRGQAWAKNVGWRIDYQILSPGLAGTPQRAHIHKEPRFSDHAPLIMDYRL